MQRCLNPKVSQHTQKLPITSHVCPDTYCHLEHLKSSESQYSHQDSENNIQYDPDVSDDAAIVDELNVVCPSHTTERKLLAKIDLRVLPVLSILYLLAFLDR